MFMLTSSKLNSIESKISESLMNNQIIHEDFVTIMKTSNGKTMMLSKCAVCGAKK